tara:strand:+ start:2515 stop:3189 length:675 start_codon:yes stop_codon:yes gene_type:complete
MLKTIELFSGTGSFSRVALNRGYDINTYDLADHADELVEGTHTQCNILDRNVVYPKNVDMLWASPPCEGFSVAVIGRNWNKDHTPKTETARLGLEILERTIELIANLKPVYWYLENPRGKMRKVIDDLFEAYGIADYVRHTVTYCSYSKLETRMKPTDIWSNDPNWTPRPMCKNYRYDSSGNIIDRHCHHESARRGSPSGTQGIKGARNRSRIPSELFEEIFSC